LNQPSVTLYIHGKFNTPPHCKNCYD